MKKILLAVTVAAAFAGAPSCALAQQAAQADAATTALLDAMDTRKMLAASFAEMQKTLPEMMRMQITAVINADPNMGADKKREALARVEQMLPAMLQAMNRTFSDPALIDEMMKEIAPLYTKNYTSAELKELTAFYRTPLGRKMLALTPRLSAESMAIGQRIVAPRLAGMMQEMMKNVQSAQGK